MGDSVTIPARFNGPLDTPLSVARDGEGEARILDGEDLVAEVRAAPGFQLDVPAPVGVAEAREAATRYRGTADGPFGRCFVCGLGREDSMGVTAGAVAGRELVASPWTPPEWTADDGGEVRPEIVWGALDCPTYFATYAPASPCSRPGARSSPGPRRC